jgi:hypothetical protein
VMLCSSLPWARHTSSRRSNGNHLPTCAACCVLRAACYLLAHPP